MQKTKKFQKIKERLAKFQEKAENQKVITIVEVLENKDREDEEDLKEEDLSQPEKIKKKYLSRPDIQEALNVAKDLVLIQKTTRSSRTDLSLQ